MKTGRIFVGICLLLLAVVLVLDAVGVMAPITALLGDLSVWRIILGVLLVAFMIQRISQKKVAEIFIPLALLFMLFEKNIAHLCGLEKESLLNNWLVLLIGVLLSIAFQLLFGGPVVKVTVSSSDEKEDDDEDSRSHAGGSLSRSAVYVDCESMTPNTVENNLGSCEIYFQNVELYAGGKSLWVDNNLGSMTVYVPQGWNIVSSIDNSLGSVTLPNEVNIEGPVLYIKGENNLGSLSIIYC